MTDGYGRHDVQWDGRKWRNRPHWQFAMVPLGEDSHGRWLAVPSGTVVRRGRQKPFRLPDGFVSLIPTLAWWQAEFYLSHPTLEIYVNIGTPCESGLSSIRQVDLDLDVVRTREGSVEIIDEDEFIDHQVRFRYPPELIEGAERAASDVATMLKRRVEPFDQASQLWLERAGAALHPDRLPR